MPKDNQVFASPAMIGLKRLAQGEQVAQLQTFLHRFGYLQVESRDDGFKRIQNPSAPTAPIGVFDEATEEAVRSYQQFHALPVTGVLDERTAEEMGKPRCGFPDHPQTAGVSDFVAQGNKWDHANITYRIMNFTPDLTQNEVRTAVQQAFAVWAEVVPLTFTEVTGSADILIRFVSGDHGDGTPFDGAGHVLAHAFYPPPNGGDIAGDAHFDEAETWTVNGSGGFDLVSVMAHEFGHSLGLDHSTVANALMFPTYHGLQRFLQQDDIDGIQSIYGRRYGQWQNIDKNPATTAIAADGDSLYQLHGSGRIWTYTGVPITGWQELDNNPATRAITVSAGHLYQLHNNGRIWRYTGVPHTGWQEIDNNPATASITAAGNELYQLHVNGRIWRYTGVPHTGWQELDNNSATKAIAASPNHLYQLHANGRIWRYTGVPHTGWQEIDNNPATVAIVADGENLYQLHNNGRIWRYTGVPHTGWQEIDNNPATKAIAAAGGRLYQIHQNGRIWRYTGVPHTGWQDLDNNPASKSIAAGGTHLYQLHNNGLIWRFTGN
ncbi:matrixin family metalloprotease [Paenibacillus glycinis]|uniref:Matrixin family metalloprotease n=1 Tax=Paenibacillus glycinis TaxID=2697035 RepID=A0ABW9XN85_9BACL|nr:matrixin family metalloprotease [Paenibacillus glycinis]NBD24092.1 matrixin family metalloprotease [Paenibacillus glycinis]